MSRTYRNCPWWPNNRDRGCACWLCKPWKYEGNRTKRLKASERRHLQEENR